MADRQLVVSSSRSSRTEGRMITRQAHRQHRARQANTDQARRQHQADIDQDHRLRQAGIDHAALNMGIDRIAEVAAQAAVSHVHRYMTAIEPVEPVEPIEAVEPVRIPDNTKGDELPQITLLFSTSSSATVPCSNTSRHKADKPVNVRGNFWPALCSNHRNNETPLTGWAFITAAEQKILNILRRQQWTARALRDLKREVAMAGDEELEGRLRGLGVQDDQDDQDDDAFLDYRDDDDDSLITPSEVSDASMMSEGNGLRYYHDDDDDDASSEVSYTYSVSNSSEVSL